MRNLRLTMGILLLGPTLARSAPAPWLEVKSQHFTVLSNSGEKAGRRAAWQFEQVRQALLVIWPWAAIDGGRPITVLAVRDEATLKSLGPQYWEGKRYRPTSFWVSGPDRQYIALRTDLAEPDDVGENPYQAAYWNYVSLVFHRSTSGDVPDWYSRGITTVLSNTIVREKELHVGRLMSDHLREIRSVAAIPPADFFAADRRSRYRTGEVESFLFDSQAWAFVHFLLFGNRGEHNGRVTRFNQLLLSGRTGVAAMQEAFGPDMTPYFEGMRAYVKQGIFQYGRIPLAIDQKPEGFSSRSVDPAESAILRANLLVAMGRPVEARATVAEGSKADPANPGLFEIDGLLFDREGKTAEAKNAYARAVEMGSKRAHVYYRLARLSRPDLRADRATSEKLAALLERAIELEPGFANALSYLADVKVDLGRGDEAIGLARKAIKVEPDSSYHRMTLARALWNTHQADPALEAARSALTVADTDEERTQVRRFLDFAAAAPRSAAPSASVVVAKAPESASAAATPPGGVSQKPLRVDETAAQAVNACIENGDNAACGKAIPLLRAQCDEANGYACRALGSLHDGGFGVPMNKALAGAAYDAGCRASDKPSCARYAVLQLQGFAVPHTGEGGLATLGRLCGESVDDACVSWALVLSSRKENRDLTKARALLEVSCSGNNQEACRLLKSLPKR